MLAYLALAALLVTVGASELISPCPGSFEYSKDGAKDGSWEGTLTLKSDHKLHGVWIRVFFDKPVKEVKLFDESITAYSDDPSEYLLKNKEMLLTKHKPTEVKFKVIYEGKEAPALVKWRLNARDVCPEDKD